MRAGALIGLGFGLLWWCAGAAALSAPARTIITAVGIALFAAAISWTLVRSPRGSGDRPRWRYYVVAVIAEIVAIALTQAWLDRHGLSVLLLPAVGVIAGLHFIGLWLAFARRRFLGLAGAMSAIDLVALLAPISSEARQLLAGFGSATALLIVALLP